MRFSNLRSARITPFLGVALCFSALTLSSPGEEPLPAVERLQTSPVLRHLKKNPMLSAPVTPAEQTVAQMYVPEGFRAELILAEPDVHQPIAFAFDERGRIWVAEAYSYPQKRPSGEGLDRIVIFTDTNGDGQFDSRKIFAEGLNLISGFEVGFGGVWVGAAPELLFIPDRNHDDMPDDPPEILLDGFGYQDTHECLNSFLWGPDGWLYGNQGVFNFARIGKPGASESDRVELRAGVWRYHPVRHEFEVFAHGGSNPWGLDYDEHGQIFMTHCRSYWGRGMTTHVIQGGHFWNQSNAHHAPYIIPNPPEGFPDFRNYLLASAQYGHGAGGAGPRGSDAIYGGHSHVGTMIYLGDNWPDQFRGHLFTHNLGGHQMNQQINNRLGSGFQTVHAGQDQLFCTDPKYVAVDLQYGPDGAVYSIDWYDRQHCHNPNTERWERDNGRIYRLQYDPTYKPVTVNLGAMTDSELVGLHTHKNEWHVRTARRLLNERSLERPIAPDATKTLRAMASDAATPALRLRALWTLHAIDRFDEALASNLLVDPNDFVRSWVIQLLCENGSLTVPLETKLIQLAASDPSPTVRLYLASAIQRLSSPTAWALIEALALHSEDAGDRNLPLLLWQSLAERMPGNVDRAFKLADTTKIPALADYIGWYAASLGNDDLEHAIDRLGQLRGEAQNRLLAGVALAMDNTAGVPMPAAWKRIAPQLYASSMDRVRKDAQKIAAAFGDNSMFESLRTVLATRDADPAQRRHAFSVLSRALDLDSLPVFLKLLDDPGFRSQSIGLLARFNSQDIPSALLSRFAALPAPDQSSALNTLTSRTRFAESLLDAVAAGELRSDALTSFHIRQLGNLNDEDINHRVAATWGNIQKTPAAKLAQIDELEDVFNQAPLWAYDAGAGGQHFQKLCSQCHQIGEIGTRIGPELTGAGKNGIRYFLENIIDPNAVIGLNYQMTQVETADGEMVSGLLVNETPTALTIQTTTDQVVLAKSAVTLRSRSELSLMPEALFDSLNAREKLELLKFLTSN